MRVIKDKLWILFIVLAVLCHLSYGAKKPHIICILADDMGFNDVGFHGADQIPTPNIDALAYNGIILNSHYSQALCTPSRAAFLTGKYPIHTGMQHLVILESEPRGLPLNEKILPQYLKEAGYSTHAVGKWHLGFYKTAYTPLHRGFDTHFGYWNGLQDYYTHWTHATYQNVTGFDMRRGMKVAYDTSGKYSTTLFTEEAVKLIHNHKEDNPMFLYLSHLAPHSGNDDAPLQAPDEEIAKFAHIPDPQRRIYAAMVSLLDKSIGEVITALRQKKMLENSIILFMSDNGAQPQGVHANSGSNYPFRGSKATPWEGGMRTLAAIWSPLLKKSQFVWDETIHMSDWLPTLLSGAGISTKKLKNIDGINMWDAISTNQKSPRSDMLYNIDDVFNYVGFRRGDFKYLSGTIVKGQLDGWYGDTGLGPQYSYNTTQVLRSPAANALTGVVTELQIKEKEENPELKKTYNFAAKLLTEQTIINLRNASTIRCANLTEETSHLKCNPLESPCLFNLKEDPCEMINLASERPVLVQHIENEIVKMRKTIVEASNVPEDPINADPARWNNTWVAWEDCAQIEQQKIKGPLSNLAIAVLGVLCMLFFIVVMILIAISVKSSAMKKKLNNSQLFAVHDDALDSPTGVVHVVTNDSPIKPESFQTSELSRQNSIKNGSKHI